MESRELSEGARELLISYDMSPLAIAEALILGELNAGSEQESVGEVVCPIMLEAARIRLEATGRLSAEHIKPPLRWE